LGGGPSGMEPFEAAPPRGFRLNRKVYVKTVRHLDDMPMYLPTNRDGVALVYRCNEVALVMPFLFFFSPLCARLFSCCFHRGKKSDSATYLSINLYFMN